MPLSFARESPYNANSVESGYGVVYNGLGRYQGYFHGENRAKVLGLVAASLCKSKLGRSGGWHLGHEELAKADTESECVTGAEVTERGM